MVRSITAAALAGFLGLAAVAAAVTPARAAGDIVLPRAGQVGIGMQVQGGSLLSAGELGREFGGGPGLTFKVRYRMRFERAIGLTFDAQQLHARRPFGGAGAFDSLQDFPAVKRDRLKLNTAAIEFYQMFDTRERTVKMLSAGIGFAQVSAHLTDGETQIPLAGDGIFLSAGAGLERFVFHSWAWDLSSRYLMLFHDGKMNHDLQAQLGLIFYAAY